jgi:hypothetical protein
MAEHISTIGTRPPNPTSRFSVRTADNIEHYELFIPISYFISLYYVAASLSYKVRVSCSKLGIDERYDYILLGVLYHYYCPVVILLCIYTLPLAGHLFCIPIFSALSALDNASAYL